MHCRDKSIAGQCNLKIGHLINLRNAHGQALILHWRMLGKQQMRQNLEHGDE